MFVPGFTYNLLLFQYIEVYIGVYEQNSSQEVIEIHSASFPSIAMIIYKEFLI